MTETAIVQSSRPPRPRLSDPSPRAIELVGRSEAAVRIQELVRRSVQADTCVLVVGEPGTDGSAVACDLHQRSRPSGPCVSIDCAGTAPSSDYALFGTVAPGGPTDLEAVSADSRLAASRGGTLLLKDVGELPASAQARLARVLRDREFRVDGEPVPADMRIIATASPSIDADLRENRFRTDLYRRLAASRIDLPSLRDRADDVPEMAERLLHALSEDGAPRTFTNAALALLGALSWPGNVIELKGVVEGATARCHDGAIQVEHVLPALKLERAPAHFSPAGKLREARLRFERDYIAAVLQHHGWRMSEAAKTLGIQRPNLYRKARQLGIPVARLSE